MILHCYVDDGFTAEPSGTIDSAYKCIIFLADILGFTLAPEKLVPPCTELELLGAKVKILKETIEIENPADKLARIREFSSSYLKSKRMSPATAATLRGKLGFTQQLCAGRFGKAMTVELSRRQYSMVEKTSLSRPLTRELAWWKEKLGNLPKRLIPMKKEKNNVVYTDA